MLGFALLLAMTTGTAGQNAASQAPSSSHFYWSVRKAHELNYDRTIRNTPDLSSAERAILIKTVTELIRPRWEDNEIGSERELRQVAADTRVELIDLDGDGIPEIIAQANDMRAGCGATGNCAFWVFKKVSGGYKLLLDTRDKDGIGGAELITVENSRTNGFNDFVLAVHDSAFEKTLLVYQYKNGFYRESRCYDASWISTAGGKWQNLKHPVISMGCE
ncbi:MAG: hypothetical protein ABR912_06600 [Terracidiphilus sp.]|jgi:hypothetical protein